MSQRPLCRAPNCFESDTYRMFNFCKNVLQHIIVVEQFYVKRAKNWDENVKSFINDTIGHRPIIAVDGSIYVIQDESD